MSRAFLLTALLAACTSGPSVTARWGTSSSWGDGNCNSDFTWYDEVYVGVTDGSGVIASETHACDDEGFDIALPDGDTNVSVDVTVIHHQDQTGSSPPLHFDLPGPVHGRVDLGKLDLP